jgi:hypothetical protein
MARHRHELLSFQPQQAGRVARDRAADRRQQPAVTVLGRERGREVAGDVEQRRDRCGASRTALFIR